MWDLWWTKWHWDRFSPEHFSAPLEGKTKKLIIFITGLHNKPEGCGASVASTAGPFKKNLRNIYDLLLSQFASTYMSISIPEFGRPSGLYSTNVTRER
jgi:hypothetical protein